jgi:hypothetical protein
MAGYAYYYKMGAPYAAALNYAEEFHIDDNGNGISAVKWSAQFDIVENKGGSAIEIIRGFLKAGTDSLESNTEYSHYC